MEVSRRLGIAPDTVRTWRRRFLEHGLAGLSDQVDGRGHGNAAVGDLGSGGRSR
ncbi:helix-turn-helix domain-containing protein [Streptomyces inhibens]|uniref:helix-turn-helix domain-containing protein n=1 Tax=Streptomyces inhibens TaxID=2293571 RepID=UPI0037BC1C58